MHTSPKPVTYRLRDVARMAMFGMEYGAIAQQLGLTFSQAAYRVQQSRKHGNTNLSSRNWRKGLIVGQMAMIDEIERRTRRVGQELDALVDRLRKP